MRREETFFVGVTNEKLETSQKNQSKKEEKNTRVNEKPKNILYSQKQTKKSAPENT